MGAQMARKAFRSNKKTYTGSSNQLHEAATQSRDRLPIPRADLDTRRNISELGWRELLSAARIIYANHPHIRGVIDQMVNIAVGQKFSLQYTGENRVWGEKMEEKVFEHDKICDVRGYPFDFATGLKLDLTSILRDGDSTNLLVENESAYPLYQSIPSHRIGNRNITNRIVEGGQFDGAQIVNGVISNEVGRTIGLRIYGGDQSNDDFEDIPIDSAVFTYAPVFCDQARGITHLASAINTCLDVEEIRKFLRLGVKAEAAISLIEHNEQGAPLINSGAARVRKEQPTANSPSQPSVQELHYGMYRYFKSGTNSDITAVNSKRPAAEVMNFDNELLRAALESFGWPIEMYNPSGSGGAITRLRLGLACRTIERLQKWALQIAYRKHLFTVSKLINLGELEPQKDFYKFTHQVPRDLTVDNGRDTKADLELYRIGAIDMSQLCAWYSDAEYQDIYDRKADQAAYKVKAAGLRNIPTTDIQLLTPNANDPAAMQDMPKAEPQPATKP